MRPPPSGLSKKGDHVSPLKAHAGNPVEGKPLILQFVELVVAGNDRADLFTLAVSKTAAPRYWARLAYHGRRD